MLAFRVDPFWVLALLACAPQSQNAGSLIYLYIQKAYIHHPKGFWSFKIWCCMYIYIYIYIYIYSAYFEARFLPGWLWGFGFVHHKTRMKKASYTFSTEAPWYRG